MEVQIQYDFKEYKQAFKHFYQCTELYGENEVQLIISTNWYSSGYWIETGNKELGEGDIKYSFKEAKELQKRVAGMLFLDRLRGNKTYYSGVII